MQVLGVGAFLLGYCCWYTLYQRTAGDGSGFLYNLTGAQRFANKAGTNVNTPNTSNNTGNVQKNAAIKSPHHNSP
jgi:hypothetical protein